MANIFDNVMSLLGRGPKHAAPSQEVVVAAAPPIVERAKGKKGTGGRAMPDLALWNQHQRIGGALTPQQVSQIIRDADRGMMRRLIDLANESRQKDCHLQAVLGDAEDAVSGLEWEIGYSKRALAASGRAIKSRDRKAAEWAFEHLSERVNAPFQGLIAHAAGSFYYSYSVSETMYVKDVGGRIVPADWINHSGRRFGFRPDDGRFIWRDENMDLNGIDFREEFPNKFVVAQPRVTGDVPCREGLARLLVWTALFRNWDLTDWLRTGEAAWKPWRIGTYDKEADEEDIADLESVLSKLSTNGWGVIPSTDKIEIEWPTGSGGTRTTHSELFNVLANEMSKAVLGQTETVQASTSSGFAQAKVHERVDAKRLKARAKQISPVITRDVIRPMIEMNFGGDIVVPTFKFAIEDKEDFLPFSQGVQALSKAGLRMPATWVRERIGMPEPKDEDEIVGEVDVPIDPTTGLPTDPTADDQPKETPKPADDSAASDATDVKPAEKPTDAKA